MNYPYSVQAFRRRLFVRWNLLAYAKKKRGQNSDYLFFEVLDYLNCQIMSKAHADLA